MHNGLPLLPAVGVMRRMLFSKAKTHQHTHLNDVNTCCDIQNLLHKKKRKRYLKTLTHIPAALEGALSQNLTHMSSTNRRHNVLDVSFKVYGLI